VSTEEGEKTCFRPDRKVFYSEPERNYLYSRETIVEQGIWDGGAVFLTRLYRSSGIVRSGGRIERPLILKKRWEFSHREKSF